MRFRCIVDIRLRTDLPASPTSVGWSDLADMRTRDSPTTGLRPHPLASEAPGSYSCASFMSSSRTEELRLLGLGACVVIDDDRSREEVGKPASALGEQHRDEAGEHGHDREHEPDQPYE